jgi:hypothetical protein
MWSGASPPEGGPQPATRTAAAPASSRTLRQRLMAPVELVFTVLAGSRPVPGSRGTFLVACHRHHGGPVLLPDGTEVRPGDRIAEIHFWNRRIAERRGPDSRVLTWRFARDFRADLGALARALGAGHFGPDVRAIYGASPLASGAARFGFMVRPLPPGLRRAALTRWQRGVRRIFRPLPMQADLTAESAELWMSAAELRARYGSAAAAQGDGADSVEG